MEDAAAGSAARRQRDWTSLPAGVLQLIFSRASTWQAPGPCLVAAVCRVWGEAASGCKGIRLLYHAGHPATDSCFTSWLGQNSHRLDALTLSVSRDKISKWAFQHGTVPYNADTVLVPLAAAAEDAANGGHPLPLHTLRVLGPGPSLGTIERLMGNLLNLRCLQLTGLDHSRGLDTPMLGAAPTPRSWLIAQHLGRLSAATQLEELHLKGLLSQPGDSEHMAKMLPPGLKRLSWQGWMYTPLPDLSHLTQLTSLQLVRWAPLDHATAKLPPSLQQLELRYMGASLQVLAAQQQVLTGCHVDAASLPAPTPPPRQQQQHQEQQEQQAQQQQQQQVTVHLPQVTAASVPDEQMNLPAVCAALGRLSNLSTLRMAPGSGGGMKGGKNLRMALATAGSLSTLRHLDLQLRGMPAPKGLADLTGLTRLRLSVPDCNSDTERRQAWAAELGRMSGLRWLSVPDVLLEAGWAWLGGLQQLRVLVLNQPAVATAASGHGGLAWVDGCSTRVLPPSLRVLCWAGVDAEEAAAWRLHSGLTRRLQGSGCEVVVGVDLDEVADPAQQLAGLPVALQQVLA